MIQANCCFSSEDRIPDNVYHEVLFEKGRKAADRCTCRYWLPYFSPYGYGYRFDAFANILISLLNAEDDSQQETVDQYLEHHIVPREPKLLPAFHPVIKPVDDDWEELHITFSYSFKNYPYEFHNCGLRPMTTGFYVADLAQRGKLATAEEYLAGIHQANHMAMDGESWSFPEFIHGKYFTPGGNKSQGWSASAALMAHYSPQGKKVFVINEEDIVMQ